MTGNHIWAAAALTAVALPSAANAAVSITGISGNPGFQTGRVIYTPGGIGGAGGPATQYLYIGRIHMTGTDTTTSAAVSFDSYCIDIFNYLHGGTFDLQALALADPVKEAQLKNLLGYTAGFIDAAGTLGAKQDISAAIQMAVWEIVNENGTSGYSLGNGLFQIATDWGSVVGTSRGIAQGYLDNMAGWTQPTGYNYSMMTALNPVNNQRQVFLTAVPEPSTWALLIAGFGMIGAALRKRRRATIAFA